MVRRISCFALLLAMAGLVFASSSQGKREKFGSSLSRFKRDQAHGGKPERQGGGAEAGADDIKLDTLLVVFDVLVTDGASRVATGLTKDDFVVTEEGQQQQVSMLVRGTDGRLGRSLVLIFDFSGSIAPYLEKSIAAAKKLVDQIGPHDEMAIVNDAVELVVDFTRDKSRLRSALDAIRTRERGPRGSLQLTAL